MALYASRIKRDHRPPRLPGPARPAGHGWKQGARAARPCAQKAPDVGSAIQALQRPPAFRPRPVRFVPDLVTPYIRRLRERRAMTRRLWHTLAFEERYTMTLGIALLGTGNIAQRAFVPAVHAVDGARLVAVLSRDKAFSAQAREAPLRARAKPWHSNRRIRSSAK
jgi:hypothetical protein